MSRPRNPKALRRAPAILVHLPPDEHAAAREDARARMLTVPGHVRALLRQWRKEHPARR
jgi:hypothetical protein